jgi:hypothetical protein
MAEEERDTPGDRVRMAARDSVSLVCGAWMEDAPVGGLTVGEIRRRHRDRLGIKPECTTVINGLVVTEETTVRPGQSLLFAFPAGEIRGPDR